jgi:hypothetical protein
MPDTIKINLVEVASELAHLQLVADNVLYNEDSDTVLMEETSDGLHYKEEFQGQFNEWYDHFYTEINKLKIDE